MKILCVSWLDNGGQMQALAEAIRRYTDNDALHLNILKSYLGYDTDLYYMDYKKKAIGIFELREKISGYDDFFIFAEFLPDDIFSEHLPNNLPIRPILEELGIYRKLRRNNVIIRTGGSIVRLHTEHYLLTQLKRGWMYTGAYHDYSIASQIGFVAPTRNILPIEKMPVAKPPKDKVRICFAPTKAIKGVTNFNRVMAQLEKEYDNVEGVGITGKPWSTAIAIKSTCNVTLDNLSNLHPPGAGNTSIESMYLSHAVVSKLNHWTQMLDPSMPVIDVQNIDELRAELRKLIENPKLIVELGKKGKRFVEENNSPKVVVEMWGHLIGQVLEMDE